TPMVWLAFAALRTIPKHSRFLAFNTPCRVMAPWQGSVRMAVTWRWLPVRGFVRSRFGIYIRDSGLSGSTAGFAVRLHLLLIAGDWPYPSRKTTTRGTRSSYMT